MATFKLSAVEFTNVTIENKGSGKIYAPDDFSFNTDGIELKPGGYKISGTIINQNGKNGDIHLIEPSPEGYKEVGKASFFDSKKSQAWAPLAFSRGKLIVRDLEKMVCVDLQN